MNPTGTATAKLHEFASYEAEQVTRLKNFMCQKHGSVREFWFTEMDKKKKLQATESAYYFFK